MKNNICTSVFIWRINSRASNISSGENYVYSDTGVRLVGHPIWRWNIYSCISEKRTNLCAGPLTPQTPSQIEKDYTYPIGVKRTCFIIQKSDCYQEFR